MGMLLGMYKQKKRRKARIHWVSGGEGVSRTILHGNPQHSTNYLDLYDVPY